MPKLLHPVEKCSSQLSAEEVSRVCLCPHNLLPQTLTRENAATHQGCSAAIGWEEDSVSQPTDALCFQESIQLGPLCRTSALSFNLLWQENVMLDIDL